MSESDLEKDYALIKRICQTITEERKLHAVFTVDSNNRHLGMHGFKSASSPLYKHISVAAPILYIEKVVGTEYDIKIVPIFNFNNPVILNLADPDSIDQLGNIIEIAFESTSVDAKISWVPPRKARLWDFIDGIFHFASLTIMCILMVGCCLAGIVNCWHSNPFGLIPTIMTAICGPIITYRPMQKVTGNLRSTYKEWRNNRRPRPKVWWYEHIPK
jgi:hypothetical protein